MYIFLAPLVVNYQFIVKHSEDSEAQSFAPISPVTHQLALQVHILLESKKSTYTHDRHFHY